MWLFVAIFFIALAVALLMPKPPAPAEPNKDTQAPTPKVGSNIPVLFGERDINQANIVWYGDIRLVPIKSKGGKK